MKVGIIPINVGVGDPEQMIALAQKAESVGLESAWTFEHSIVPENYGSRYPYSRSGKMAASPETTFARNPFQRPVRSA
jgi:alkanesulfonate monooxygenase SsuD/methylene tetrahydromethanopterin reductase-like flavin-dependent oxidoreductase (luciferase family)